MSLSNSRPDMARLAAHLAELTEAGNVSSIHVAAEATGNYWLPFFCQLEQAPEPAEWPVTLYPFSHESLHPAARLPYAVIQFNC
jgi:hypothetical protein